jgi:hypothetical protein
MTLVLRGTATLTGLRTQVAGAVAVLPLLVGLVTALIGNALGS